MANGGASAKRGYCHRDPAMTIRKARAILSAFWGITVAGLLLYIIVRQLLGIYGTDTKDLWVWVGQFILPGLTVIVGAWSVKNATMDDAPLGAPFVFWGAIAISFFYLLVVFLSLVYQPASVLPLKDALGQSALYLSLIQGLAVGVLTKFFVESSH
jgi:hypothetical protein